VVLADTHMRAGGRRQLPEAAYRILDRADVILHAGDVLDEGGAISEGLWRLRRCRRRCCALTGPIRR
jgi:hypothetical protein